MKTVLVTGATGFLGKQMTMRLAQDGYIVHALYRSEEKLKGLEHKNIIPFRGSLGNAESIKNAMQDCSQVYHMAAFAAPWVRKTELIYDQNVGGTENILSAALDLGIEKLVFTSTAGVLGPSTGNPNTESKIYKGEHLTHYDRSKAQAEEKVLEYVQKGLNAVIVNPTRIFGPGIRSKSNAATMIIEKYLHGDWKIIPGDGSSIGNYVYVGDVVECHLLAMEKGRSGERYLAGGENLSFNEFFSKLATVSGVYSSMVKLPMSLMMLIARVMLWIAKLTGWTPLIIPAFVSRYNSNWEISGEKAKTELGYTPLSFEEGLKKTINWLRQKI